MRTLYHNYFSLLLLSIAVGWQAIVSKTSTTTAGVLVVDGFSFSTSPTILLPKPSQRQQQQQQNQPRSFATVALSAVTIDEEVVGISESESSTTTVDVVGVQGATTSDGECDVDDVECVEMKAALTTNNSATTTTTSTINTINGVDEPPKLYEVRAMLPAESFQVDTKTSLTYFGLDLVAVVASMGFLFKVVTSDFYHAAPLWEQAVMAFPLQILTGFAMWCMWCIGHDAGHTTVSKDTPWLNRLVGEISHSMICLTPFVPWAKSHLQHHLNHNHLEKDYSHQWFIREKKDELHPLIKLSYYTRNVQLPILYLVYLLLGIPDGGHVIFYGRMWEGSSMKEKLNAAGSVAVSVATAAALWMSMGLQDFAVVCMVPWCVMSFWLFMVTYLQHHSEDGKLYTDDTFSFERGAFETVDRNYGKWTNRLSHHMMDGHVVHHLFFSRVPHYRLAKATTALVEGMEARGQSHLYKSVETTNFTQEIIKQFHNNWFFVNEDKIVRK